MKIVAITPDRKTDYLAETVIDGIHDLGIDLIASNIGNGIEKSYSDQEIIEHSKDADYIFVIWGKARGNTPPKYYLLDHIDRPERSVYIDGSEWTCTGYPETKTQTSVARLDWKKRRGNPWINNEMLEKCNWYFKRECYPEDAEAGIIPLLFGAKREFFKDENPEKTIDIFCSFGQEKDGLRSEAINLCKKLKSEGYKVVTDKNLSYDHYRNLLFSSRISIDSWGGGDCCRRLWENLAAKTCCITQRYNIVFPDDFTDGENILKYSSVEELEKKIKYVLDSNDRSNQIAENGYSHLLKYHTSKKRVEYILNKIG